MLICTQNKTGQIQKSINQNNIRFPVYLDPGFILIYLKLTNEIIHLDHNLLEIQRHFLILTKYMYLYPLLHRSFKITLCKRISHNLLLL